MKVFKKTVKAVIAGVLTLSMVLTPVLADEQDELESQNEDLMAQVQQKEQHLQELKENIADIENYIVEIDAAVEEIEGKIAEYEIQKTEKQERIIELNGSIKGLEKEIAEKEVEIGEQYDKMKMRIKFLYENVSDSYVESIVSSTSFSEAVEKIQYLLELTSYDRRMMEKIQKLVRDVEDDKLEKEHQVTEVEHQVADIVNLEEAQAANQELLEEAKEMKQVELEEANEEVRDYEAAVEDLRNQIAANQGQIDAIIAVYMAQLEAEEQAKQAEIDEARAKEEESIAAVRAEAESKAAEEAASIEAERASFEAEQASIAEEQRKAAEASEAASIEAERASREAEQEASIEAERASKEAEQEASIEAERASKEAEEESRSLEAEENSEEYESTEYIPETTEYIPETTEFIPETTEFIPETSSFEEVETTSYEIPTMSDYEGGTASGTATSFIWPLNGYYTITSYFGYRGDDPDTPDGSGMEYHYGIDIYAPAGTPILAAADGVVVYEQWSDALGNVMGIYHPGMGVITEIHHASGFAVGLGAAVSQGDTVAYVGATGYYCYGAHLHFAVIPGSNPMSSNYVDPLAYL